MYYYIENPSTDPCRNLALEQWAFDCLDRRHSYFMLWQNHNAIIVGKHQNTSAEVNAAFVKERRISVVRRLSGGGAVYHDEGNINFTFITDADTPVIDFAAFCRPISQALVSFGVPAELSGRNDMTVEGKKISGNAQYIKQGRIMHHGTILYDSDLNVLSYALNPPKAKILSKGIPSVRSGVANIRPYMQTDMPVDAFRAVLKSRMIAAFNMEEYSPNAAEEAEISRLCDTVYSRWDWNYGESPPHNIRKSRRVEGCGNFEILLDVEKGGTIQNIAFYGDFFGSEPPEALAEILTGQKLEYHTIAETIKGIDISRYFYNLDAQTFLALLFD